MENIDNRIQELFKKVELKKKEIKNIESSNWKTNCSFTFNPGSADRLNIHVISDAESLISILAFLLEKESFYSKAMEELGISGSKFTWQTYSVEEWKQDVQSRLNKINISKKKKQLSELEEKLNGLVSPEVKRQLEVAAIEALLKLED